MSPTKPKPYGERVIDGLMDGLAQLAAESDRLMSEGGSKPTPAGPALHSRAQRRAARRQR